jgi:predicted Zn-dependent peptidase
MSPLRTFGSMGPWMAAGLLLAGALAPSLSAQQAPPAPSASRPVAFPEIQRFTLENGLEVVVLDYGTQPLASVRLTVRGGEASVPAEKAGLGNLMATVLTKGTTTRSAEAITGAIEGVGGSLSAGAGNDFLSVSTLVLTEHLGTAFELLGDVVLNATFPSEEVELARRQTLSALQVQQGQPQAIFARIGNRLVYGEGHPYGVSPTPGTVSALSREDLLAHRDAVLRPEGALLMVAGRVDRGEVERLVRTHLGSWSGSAPVAPVLPPPPAVEATRIFLVHRPGSVQSVVGVGNIGPTGREASAPALQVANRLLGGGADARLFRILREEKGWTYGAYSDISRPLGPGIFQAFAEVRNAVTDSATVELLRQVGRLGDEPVPQDELEGARNFLAGSFPLRLETAGSVAARITDALLFGEPLEELANYPARMRAVTAEEVRSAAQLHMRARQAHVVVVGDATQVLEGLEAVAPVTLLDLDGNPLDRDEVLAPPPPPSWDGTRLEAGIRRYELLVEGNPLGTAEHRLERDGEDWVATSSLTSALAGNQSTTLRFSASDLTPKSLVQSQSAGGMQISADLTVVDGRIVGEVSLPAAMGGDRSLDLERGDLLLPGMDEFAMAASSLSEGVRLRIPYLDGTRGTPIQLEARVMGREEVEVPAGTFDCWRVEVSGAQPLVLYLRAEGPHILVKQEFAGQPVSLVLSGISPL